MPCKGNRRKKRKTSPISLWVSASFGFSCSERLYACIARSISGGFRRAKTCPKERCTSELFGSTAYACCTTAYASSIRFSLINPIAELIYPPPGPVVEFRGGLLGVILAGVCGLAWRDLSSSGIEPVGGTTLIVGRLIIALSISPAFDQRCSMVGDNAFMITCSKAIEISGRSERTGGNEKMLGLLLAAS